MYKLFRSIIIVQLIMYSCSNTLSHTDKVDDDHKLTVIGAMRDVMWNGKLEGNFYWDNVVDKESIFGIGPLSYLKGEVLIWDGIPLVSTVHPKDSSVLVEQNDTLSSPFFVMAKVNSWQKVEIPSSITTNQQLDQFLLSSNFKNGKPHAFKLSGIVEKASYHIQNLPDGSEVSNPQQAHKGQVKYRLDQVEVDILGFFSQDHQGVFTHHDTYTHMHIISKDKKYMGHLDDLKIQNMNLFIPN